jgi:hypothetical protein
MKTWKKSYIVTTSKKNISRPMRTSLKNLCLPFDLSVMSCSIISPEGDSRALSLASTAVANERRAKETIFMVVVGCFLKCEPINDLYSWWPTVPVELYPFQLTFIIP